MPAGYSGTPLARKLGIKEGHRVALFEAPRGFEGELEGLEEGVELVRDPRAGRFDVILLFALREQGFARRFAALADRLETNGGLWVAWPKKSSGVETDLSDSVVRRTGLEGGLVDNKVCAVNETWSGLRFVYRLKDRPRRKA